MTKRLPPKDSWITLAPGEKVTIDAEVQNKWQELTRRGREIRGNVLALCFGVEFSLDNVITRTLFADYRESDAMASLRGDTFDELVLKGRGLNFSSKIELLRKLRARISDLAEALPEDTLTELNEVRQIRNRFAHYPITFKPLSGPSGEPDLSMWRECRDVSIEVTDTYVSHAGALIAAVQTTLESANKALHESWQKGSG